MLNILIVDDSPFDRHLATSILKIARKFHVVSVADGRQALEALETTDFSVVITDLNMPEMNGLELVREINKRNSDLPTIVMTAYGSEATAMRALQSGAFSYVPKFHLKDELVKTVEAVLESTALRRLENELLGSVIHQDIRLTIPSERVRITPTIDYLQKLTDAMNLFEGSRAMHLRMVLEEALSNAIIHGNLEVSSKLREREGNAYGDLIAERSITAPYANRCVTVDVRLDCHAARFVIRDEGPGFDHSSLPDPNDPENLLRASGRGITLMHAFLDGVKYNEKGNQVTLVMNAKNSQTDEDGVVDTDDILAVCH